MDFGLTIKANYLKLLRLHVISYSNESQARNYCANISHLDKLNKYIDPCVHYWQHLMDL